MKKIFAFLLILTLTFTNGIAVLAEEVDMPPADQISSNPNYASYTWIAPIHNGNMNNLLDYGEDGLEITMARCGITKINSSSLRATAETYANIECLDIGGGVSIKQWKNNTWNTFYTFSFYDWDTDVGSVSRAISVESGYYYKVVVTHIAISADTTKSVMTSTNAIFIN